MVLAIGFLGLVAGTLTTLAGAGGGVFLIVSLSLLLGPHGALAASAPTLLVGNLHRLALYRDQVDRGIALRVVLGALPGALVGGALAVSLPETVLRAVLLVVTAYAAARALGHAAWRPPRAILIPAGAIVGGVSATSGGAGLLMAPLLLSTGLTGEPYIATSAAIALSVHVGRLAAYGARGMMSREIIQVAAVATAAIVVGNLVGDRLRTFLDDKRTALLEYGVLAISGALAVAGFAR